MQESDLAGFDRVFRRLCAGFNTPPTDVRHDAYWRSFRKLSVLEFAGLIDAALTESTFESMPTVGALWELFRKNSAPSTPPSAENSGPTIQEKLCEFAARKFGAMLTPEELSRPWTYLYREWQDGDKRCTECTAVLIERDNGTRLRVRADDMRAEAAFP